MPDFGVTPQTRAVLVFTTVLPPDGQLAAAAGPDAVSASADAANVAARNFTATS
jgi:hypothetical protein